MIERPELIVLNRATGAISRQRDSWVSGKPFRIKETYYTASAVQTANDRTEYGLVDASLNLLPGTASKFVNDIRGGEILYFDIPQSFDEAVLYQGSRRIGTVNSTAMLDGEGVAYYFVQKEKHRILYRGTTPLLMLKGYWSKLVDITEEGIYFVAPTRYGSGLYRYQNGEVVRVSKGDNILDARVINGSFFVAECVEADGYAYRLARFDTPADETPPEIIYPFENRQPKVFETPLQTLPERSTYGEIRDMHFNMLYPYIYISSKEEDSYVSLQALFSDPLYTNTLTLGYQLENNDSTFSLAYANDRYWLGFGFGVYGIDSYEERPEWARDYGGYAYITAPLYRAGRTDLRLNLYGYMDDEIKERNPLIASLEYAYTEDYGLGMKAAHSWSASLYGKDDRDESIYGGKAAMGHNLGWESYLSLDAQITTSTFVGSKLTGDRTLYEDSTDFFLIGQDRTYYAQTISQVGIGLEKVIYVNGYFLYFPISLRRESLFARYDRVRLEGRSGQKLFIDQSIIGMNFDWLLLHKLPLVSSLMYVTNSDSSEDYQVIFDIGYKF